VILLAVRWYLRYGLSYRDLEELLAERGIGVDHVTLYRWVQRFTPQLVDAARPSRHCGGDRWWVDETYVKVSGQWRYLYRAVDQFAQVIDVMLSDRRDAKTARRFFDAARVRAARPVEVTTDRAPSTRWSSTSSCPGRSTTLSSTPTTGSRPITATQGSTETDAGPQDRPQRRGDRGRTRLHPEPAAGHHELGVDQTPKHRLAAAFDELARTI
jgi:IS6 family transposase